MKVNDIITTDLNEGWMPHEDGSFSAEESDIRDYIQHDRARVRCPKCRQHVDPRTFKAHTDREGDITHWSHKHECGAPLTVFNDSYVLTGKMILEAKRLRRKSRPHNVRSSPRKGFRSYYGAYSYGTGYGLGWGMNGGHGGDGGGGE